MNRAERRLLAKAKGDPARAMQMAKHRAVTGARGDEASSLAMAMADEVDAQHMDAFEDACVEFAARTSFD